MSFLCKLGHILTYFWSFDLLRSIQSKWHFNSRRKSLWSFIWYNFRNSYW